MSEIFEWGPPEFTPEQKEHAEAAYALLRRAADRVDMLGEAKKHGYEWWFLLGCWLRSAAAESLEVGPDYRATEFATALLEGDVDLSSHKESKKRVQDAIRFKEPDW